MQRRHQGRALAAGRHVAAAEIRHHVDARQLCQQRGLLALAGIAGAIVQAGPMAHGLAVRADRRDGARRLAGIAQQGSHASRIDARQPIGRQRLAVDFIIAGLLQRCERVAQLGGEGLEGRRQHRGPWPGEIDQHAVRAVHAGAGHDADEAV